MRTLPLVVRWFVTALALAVAAPLALSHSALAQRGEQPAPRPSLYEPALSPDGSEIAFVSGGDIWTVAASGGEARLLVSDPATESRPLYSPDGKRLAFSSTRTGEGDIYTLTFATGRLTRLTWDDGLDQLDGWSRDGKWLYFSSTSHDISGMSDIYRVAAAGGTPMPVSADRYASEYWAAPSPDGNTLAFTARGVMSSQWWRKGHSHLDESEIWLRHDGAEPRYEQVTEGGAKSAWPMWGRDGRTLYFMSDRSGAENLWMQPVGGTARQLTKFTDGRVLWPSIAYDGRAIAFERDMGVWILDPASGSARPVSVSLRGAPAGPGIEHLALTRQFRDLALSPDGKKIAFVVRGEVFAASAKDGGDAARVTTTPASESQVVWSPDSRRLAYVSDRDGASHLYIYDFRKREETRLTSDSASDVTPRWSPDGKRIAFLRGGRELRVIDVATRAERLLATGEMQRAPFLSSRPFDWSHDGRWIAYLSSGGDGGQFTNAYVVPAAGGDAHAVSFLPNAFARSISWSDDGSYLLLSTSQRTEMGQLARVDLVPRTPHFREDQFRDLFHEESPDRNTPASPVTDSSDVGNKGAASDSGAPKAAQRVRVVFDGIRQRASLLPTGVDVADLVVSPDGKNVLLTAQAAGEENLYLYSLDDLQKEPAVAKQITSTPGRKDDAQFSANGKDVYFLEGGRINVVTLESRKVQPIAVTAEMDVDFDREKREVFAQTWSYLNDNFFDADFNGVDWKAARAKYAPYIAGARTPDEMRRVTSLMIGELDASHSGIRAPRGDASSTTGRLGLRFDRSEYERNGRLRVIDVVPLGPAALSGEIDRGDYLLAVNGTTVDARTNLDALLEYGIGRRVELTVSSAADGKGKRTVAVRPVDASTAKGLLYREWVEDKRAYVAKASGGRLGYVHMYDMSAGSLEQLYLDLDVENRSRDGVVVDVRNNNGGFVNAYALDVLTRQPYLTMTTRGRTAASARTQLGQRSLELPTVLVTNQHSLSDAEDFTEGYRAMGLGKVVGAPTAGWIVYTSNVPLIDGSTVRLPSTRITTTDGSPMEMHPRPVDVTVIRPIGESYTTHDSQLDAAIATLLEQIGKKSKPAVGSR
ncbi:MAG TPA: LpqB family beta-propeller domain-containing protein [Gemmatimonadaceae bacterium]|nr:LpqB family beta-propeller domain-containing protein [Gemmatimonadaceae bacterium]